MKWIARETDMEITGSYLHSLAGGAISSPGEDKLEALAQAMGFPMEWWDEPVELGAPGLREELQEVKVEAVMARLTFVPPERRAKVLERISQLIDEVQEEG
ncbi:MAG: hypothetical protein JXA37_02545 [Chloroflexia bacterium]|nr:hypothetical protein [Chloroflexia bacterium]